MGQAIYLWDLLWPYRSHGLKPQPHKILTIDCLAHMDMAATECGPVQSTQSSTKFASKMGRARTVCPDKSHHWSMHGLSVCPVEPFWTAHDEIGSAGGDALRTTPLGCCSVP
jgi:hypothetical protein